MPAVATTEPDQITAGETVAWSKSLAEYPATGGYTLKYALQLAGADLITLTSTASGAAHAISVSAATSAAWTPGVYLWTAYVDGPGSTRHTVARGLLSVLPSALTSLGTTHAQRALALIEAALEGRIPRGLEHTNIDGQEIGRIPISQLHALRKQYRAEVAAETAAARATAGVRTRRTIGIRFTAP